MAIGREPKRQRIPHSPFVVATAKTAIRCIDATCKSAGVLTPDKAFAKRCTALGTLFTAVAIDAGILARGSEMSAHEFKASSAPR